VIVSGRVKVSRRAADRSIVVDVYGPEEFFGEGALLDLERLPEEAMAMENTEVMRWTKREIEQLVLDRPLLGVALKQTLARRTIDLGARPQDCLGEKSAGRLLRSLVHLSERSGAAVDAVGVHLMPMTHQELAEYIGTSREIVAQYMKEFRRQGVLHYSHQGIVLTQRAFQLAERGAYSATGLNNAALDGRAA
jgi:CRP/FNR family transcriptional regulator, cyclic AMP receptor protein